MRTVGIRPAVYNNTKSTLPYYRPLVTNAKKKNWWRAPPALIADHVAVNVYEHIKENTCFLHVLTLVGKEN